MVIRVDAAYMDYERHGFFRIGLLPMAVLDGVTFEPQQTVLPADVLNRVAEALGVEGWSHVELRRFKFVSPPARTLAAERVKCLNGGQWRLMSGIRLTADGREVNASRGTLFLEGKQAGQLVLENAPRLNTSFLSVSTENK
jgi:hypothetical protein